VLKLGLTIAHFVEKINKLKENKKKAGNSFSKHNKRYEGLKKEKEAWERKREEICKH